ncbi:MAG: methylenetetrahydrofolate--tRNA-(uracil(54)-C(5))-methyltransferase (FADH(2)-oxidizing) TrmFO, partial [Rhodospirillaceae bacterium]|nr:methylenetetrahydrofolate--tRNA-(uracil(54)-C(5))-methyltransferase (FADH(2)-oxidizing) TrmFO [Rhodospirillaceae bacterium]
VTNAIGENPLIEVRREEITDPTAIDAKSVIIATGPLTSDGLSQSIRKLTGSDQMAFFDAIAPIIHKDSIDFEKAWFQSRYDKGDGNDYINLPMSKDQYDGFIDALITGEKVSFKEWEENTPYFEGCLPIEVMAERGPQTLSYGPMKPVGLTNPHNPTVKPNAIVQLRQDNKLGTLWNMVGFQTKLTYGEQKRIFKTIPGLEGAEFARLGGLHRNTFIKSPELLDGALRLKSNPKIRFAGQITGCEGYVESSAMGIMAGRFTGREMLGLDITPPPITTAMGALLAHVTVGAEADTFQPMNINFGLFPLPDETRPNGRPLKGRERKASMAKRALKDFDAWINS